MKRMSFPARVRVALTVLFAGADPREEQIVARFGALTTALGTDAFARGYDHGNGIGYHLGVNDALDGIDGGLPAGIAQGRGRRDTAQGPTHLTLVSGGAR